MIGRRLVVAVVLGSLAAVALLADPFSLLEATGDGGRSTGNGRVAIRRIGAVGRHEARLVANRLDLSPWRLYLGVRARRETDEHGDQWVIVGPHRLRVTDDGPDRLRVETAEMRGLELAWSGS